MGSLPSTSGETPNTSNNERPPTFTIKAPEIVLHCRNQQGQVFYTQIAHQGLYVAGTKNSVPWSVS